MIAAIVVNYNAGQHLVRCIKSLLACTGAGAEGCVSEIIVVDNASADDSLQMLQALAPLPSPPPFQILRSATNLGFSAACNLGVRSTSAPYCLFLNPDAEATPEALRNLFSALKARPEAAAAGGPLMGRDGIEQAGGRRYIPTLRSSVGLGPRPLHLEPFTAPTPVPAISGAYMLVRRSALQSIGGWDERFFLHLEDLDLCQRLGDAGWRILYVPNAPARHVKGACSQTRPLFVEWHKHRGMARFFLRHQRQRGILGGLFNGLALAGIAARFAGVAVSIFLRRRGLPR